MKNLFQKIVQKRTINAVFSLIIERRSQQKVRKIIMETQNIQVTLTLTPEQLPVLMALLNAQPPAPQPTQMPTAQPVQQIPLPQAQPMPMQSPQPMPMQPQQSIQQNPMPTAPPPVMPTQTPPVQQAPVPMPTAQPQTYSVQDLGLAARPLMENGRQQELIALLAEFGVPSVAQIPEDRRADFAARLRALGGQI